MPSYKIPLSFIWYWFFFFLKIKYFAFIVKKMKKKINEFSTKNFKLPNGPKFKPYPTSRVFPYSY
jgi:hypothetical protein